MTCHCFILLRNLQFITVPIILHTIDAYIFYMLAKQDEEIQPHLSGAEKPS